MNIKLIKEHCDKTGFNRWDIFKVGNKEYVSFGFVDEHGCAVPFGPPYICYESGNKLVLFDPDEAFEILDDAEQWNHIKNDGNDHYYIDLGLPSGTLWAVYNIGANAENESGDYFAWGEVDSKQEFRWTNYCHAESEDNTYTIKKYCQDTELGKIDNISTLTPSDDVATVRWGEHWSLPTKEQVNELLSCVHETVCKRGINSHRFKGPNGAKLYKPYTGAIVSSRILYQDSSGFTWTKDLGNMGNMGHCLAYHNGIPMTEWSQFTRSSGMPVRAVYR